MAKYFILLIICLGATTCKLFGQKLPSIQLDRPDQTECPFITPKKYIQIENGFTIENKDKNQKTYYYPSSLWKFGVNEKFELRLITGLIFIQNYTDLFQPKIKLIIDLTAVLPI
jgi:hypothetical protein